MCSKLTAACHDRAAAQQRVCLHRQVDCFSYGVVLWEIITKERSQRGNWRPVRVPEECPAEVDALLQVSSLALTLTHYFICTPDPWPI